MLSVIVPVHNEADSVDELASALKQQTAKDSCEVIFVDNNSTDDTPRILRDLTADRSEWRVIDYSERQGSYAARNAGIRESDGEVIAFTDADCRPRPDWLQSGLECMEHRAVDLVAGRIEMTYEDNQPNAWEYLDTALHLNQKKYADEGWGATANLFVRRSVFEEFGLFDPARRTGGDTDFGRRVTDRGGSIAYCDEAVVDHPARRTFREFVEKELRLARGQAKHAEEQSVTMKDFLPAYWFPRSGDHTLPIHERARVLFGANLVRWLQAWYLLFGGEEES